MAKNKSTGPITAEGKKVVAKNAMKHGLTSVDPSTLPQSEQQEFQLGLQALQDEYQPQTATEMIMVERVAMLFQKMKRLQRIENILFEVAKNDASNTDKIFKAAGISEENMLSARLKRLKNKYNIPLPDELLPSYIIEEIKNTNEDFEPNNFQMIWPNCYQLLLDYAEAEGENIQDYLLNKYDNERYKNKLYWDNKKNVASVKEIHDIHKTFGYLLKKYIEDLRTIHANQLEIDDGLKQYTEKEQLLINQAMPNDKDMEKLMRYQTTIERQFSKALSDLIVLIDRRSQKQNQ
jgi:hypothetical protein